MIRIPVSFFRDFDLHCCNPGNDIFGLAPGTYSQILCKLLEILTVHFL